MADVVPVEGDRVASIDRNPHYDGRLGTVVATAMIKRRGKDELRVWIAWDGGRPRTWLAVSAYGKRWKYVEARR